ncbi:MAG: hypothetical protein ACE5J5_01240 [Candidatus Hydrothermarchaeales archaeon]
MGFIDYLTATLKWLGQFAIGGFVVLLGISFLISSESGVATFFGFAFMLLGAIIIAYALNQRDDLNKIQRVRR